MSVLTPPKRDSVSHKTVPLSAFNLYIERMKSVSNNLRMTSAGYEFLPFQMGGLSNQQKALAENVPITIIEFQMSGENK